MELDRLGGDGDGPDTPAADTTAAWVALEQAVIGKAVDLVSGPGGLASFLRRRELGVRLGGPSLPLDIGYAETVPAGIRNAVLHARGHRLPHPPVLATPGRTTPVTAFCGEQERALIKHPHVDPSRVVLVGRSFGGLIAPRGASAEHRLAAMIVDPGQLEMGSAVRKRLGDLGRHLDDPAADARFEGLLTIPALRTFLAPRMATHGLTSVRGYVRDLLRYTSQDTAPAITCPGYVTGNETDTVSAGQGKALFDRLTCPREFRLFTRAEGAEGHREGMAPIISWTAAFDWLDHLLT